MTGKLDFSDAHTKRVCVCRKLCLTTCLLTSIVQVIAASASICDLFTTMHSFVLHSNRNGNSALPALMFVLSNLALSLAFRIQQRWFGSCTCTSNVQIIHVLMHIVESKKQSKQGSIAWQNIHCEDSMLCSKGHVMQYVQLASQPHNAIVSKDMPLFLAPLSTPLAAGAHICLQPMRTLHLLWLQMLHLVLKSVYTWSMSHEWSEHSLQVISWNIGGMAS